MKVIQILPELQSGGVERGTLEVGEYLVSQGHESIVISNGGRMVSELEAAGSRHIQLPVHQKRLSSLKQVKVLRKLFEREQPDIIHMRSRIPAWLTWLAWRKMHPQTRPRLVSTVHGFNSVNFYSKIMTRGERVICVSDSVRQYILTNYELPSSERYVTIHRGVDKAQYHSDFRPSDDWLNQWHEDYPETKGKYLITLPGRITRLKGHEDFFQIIARLKDSQFHGVIAGGAHPKKQDYLASIQSKASEMGIADRITFTGHRGDLKEILSHSDLVLSLTQQPESFGRTTLEALTLGTPVIGYGHGGVGEILDQLLPEGMVQFGQTDAVAQKIQNWAKCPPTPNAVNPFTLQQMLEGTVGLYQELLAQARN